MKRRDLLKMLGLGALVPAWTFAKPKDSPTLWSTAKFESGTVLQNGTDLKCSVIDAGLVSEETAKEALGFSSTRQFNFDHLTMLCDGSHWVDFETSNAHITFDDNEFDLQFCYSSVTHDTWRQLVKDSGRLNLSVMAGSLSIVIGNINWTTIDSDLHSACVRITGTIDGL